MGTTTTCLMFVDATGSKMLMVHSMQRKHDSLEAWHPDVAQVVLDFR